MGLGDSGISLAKIFFFLFFPFKREKGQKGLKGEKKKNF